MSYPTTPRALEDLLSTPNEVSVRAMSELEGNLMLLGAGGKMGPSLARLAHRSVQESSNKKVNVIAVSRFTNRETRSELEKDGISTLALDLTDPDQRKTLPPCENVVIMVAHKFGSAGDPGIYWGMNTLLPSQLAEQFRASRIVCFSSGNVYPFVAMSERPPLENSSVGPIGDYAVTVAGREGALRYISSRFGTPVTLVRLNYAVEPRYGVLVDLAQHLVAGTAIDLNVPEVNFVWQGYANSVTLGCIGLADSPAVTLNVTGLERHRVKDLAEGLAQRLNIKPVWGCPEGAESLISDATRCNQLFGGPEFDPAAMMDMVAQWILADGKTLGKPTKFQINDGKF